jgi:aryl-alcohol dehydrogenase-like predicted oxidoreductase
VDYSLLNREAEQEFIPYCQEQGIGILVRGPLSKGILSGRYNLDSEFTDTVRSGWNQGGDKRDFYEQKLKDLECIKQVVGEADLIETSLRFITTHSADMVVIPGATKPGQVLSNAAAGAEKLDAELYQMLIELA